MQNALADCKISEGHTRPLMMLGDRPEEQMVLFKEIIQRKMTVREAEGIARRIAYDKVRKKEYLFSPEIIELEEKLTEALGTRVQIEAMKAGGKIHIDYFSENDLRNILEFIKKSFDEKSSGGESTESMIQKMDSSTPLEIQNDAPVSLEEQKILQNDVPQEEVKKEEDEVFNLDNFTV